MTRLNIYYHLNRFSQKLTVFSPFEKITRKLGSTVKIKNNSENINSELFPEDVAH